jgi:hypothetical protein
MTISYTEYCHPSVIKNHIFLMTEGALLLLFYLFGVKSPIGFSIYILTLKPAENVL